MHTLVLMTIYTQHSIYSELADFLLSQPSLEAIAEYKVPPGVQQHVDDLLEKNRRAGYPQKNALNWKKSWRLLIGWTWKRQRRGSSWLVKHDLYSGRFASPDNGAFRRLL